MAACFAEKARELYQTARKHGAGRVLGLLDLGRSKSVLPCSGKLTQHPFYPVQYEGVKRQSGTRVYTGAAPNQQAITCGRLVSPRKRKILFSLRWVPS